MTSPTPPQPTTNHRTRRMTIIAVVIFLLCGLAYGIYWFGWGQYSESTDDSYVNGNMIILMAQEEGIITKILADNTQLVEQGQPLVELDRHDFKIALDGTKADLANAVREVAQLFIKVDELDAKREISRAELTRASLDYEHRQILVEDGSISREDFEHSETTLTGAFASVIEVEKQIAGAVAEVQNTTLETHPKVEMAKSELRKAYLALHRCTVLAPARGIVTQRSAQVGQRVTAMAPLLAVVPVDQMWVDANLREVNLRNIRIGQPVELTSDMYGHSVKYHGKVVGLNPGTGSVFSILPPQNATGNWIKIIQRIPVKISLDPKEVADHPLVLGLTMTTKIYTHCRKGLRLPAASEPKPIYETDVYADELTGADELIQKIIQANYDNRSY
ncbi:MAG TPA: efflux RND transporter periplasmic adaptor subunit [Rhabdochlamydiaceae bacterium]